MLIVRAGAPRSGRSSTARLNVKFADVESWTPPPARRQ
jgi:hypothetical protein